MPVANSVSITNNTKNVVGNATSITTATGDLLIIGDKLIGVVDTFNASTQTAVLKNNWTGGTLTDRTDFTFIKTSDTWNTVVTFNEEITRFLDLVSKGIPFKPDRGGPLADRAQYDGMAAGFSFLRTDVDPGLLYLKRTSTSGDWTAGVALKGDPGTSTAGVPGPANTLSIGTVSGGGAASATITGTAPNQVLNLVLPQGATGPSPVFSMGSVTSGPTPSATITGTALAPVLNLVLPKGDTGNTGPVGPAPSLSIGTVVSGASPSVTVSGSSPNYSLNFVLPKGDPGVTPAFSIGTVGTGTAAVTISGTPTAPILNFTVPQGPAGPTGPAPNLAMGAITTGAEGTSAIATITGTTPNYTLNLTIPRGNTGASGITPAFSWTLAGTTTDADPGPGNIKFNNSTVSSVTFLYIDDLDFNGTATGPWVDSLDDNANPGDRGRITLFQSTDLTKFATFKVTGSVVVASGYRKIPVTHVASVTPLTGRLYMHFSPAGAPGAGGNVFGPSASVAGHLALFDAADGTLLRDGGLPFSGDYNDLINRPSFGSAATANTGTSSGNVPVLDSGGKLAYSIIPTLAFESATLAAAATIPTSLVKRILVKIDGVYTVYEYYGTSAPPHAMYIRTNTNTAYWELSRNQILTVEMLGLVGDNVTYNDTALVNASTYLQYLGGDFYLLFKRGATYKVQEAFTSTSTSDHSLATTGTKIFKTQLGKPFVIGQKVLIQYSQNPSDNWLYGSVTAYAADGLGQADLTVNVTPATSAELAVGFVASTSSVASGTGTGGSAKSFQVPAGKGFVAGQAVRIQSYATPTDTMTGVVNNYSGTTLLVDVSAVGGVSGATHSDWLIIRTDTLGGSIGGTWTIRNAGAVSGAMLNLSGLKPFEINGNGATLRSDITVGHQTPVMNIVNCDRPKVHSLSLDSGFTPPIGAGSTPGFMFTTVGMTAIYSQQCLNPLFDFRVTNFSQGVAIQWSGPAFQKTRDAYIRVWCVRTLYPVDGDGWEGKNTVVIYAQGAHRAFNSYNFQGEIFVVRKGATGAEDVPPDDVILNVGSGVQAAGSCTVKVVYIDLESTVYGGNSVSIYRLNNTTLWRSTTINSVPSAVPTSKVWAVAPTDGLGVVGAGVFIRNADNADQWLSGLVTGYSGGNLTVNVTNYGYTTSNTSLLIATGAKTFFTQPGKNFAAYQTVVARSAANLSNFMTGIVTAYNSGTGQLDVNVTSVGGSGTFTDWQIQAINNGATTSTTSLLIGTGSKTFTTTIGATYAVGQNVTAKSNANNANFMTGAITAWDPTTGIMTVNVTSVGGSGTFADWRITADSVAKWDLRWVEQMMLDADIQVIMKGPSTVPAVNPQRVLFGRLIGDTHPSGDIIKVKADVTYLGQVPAGTYIVQLFPPETGKTMNEGHEDQVRIRYDVRFYGPDLVGDTALGTFCFGLDDKKGGQAVIIAPNARIQRYNRKRTLTATSALNRGQLDTRGSVTLDLGWDSRDKETGTFTPGIGFGAGPASVGVAYTNQIGRYTKEGNIVTARGRVTLSSKGSSTGALTLTGLPFVAAGGHSAIASLFINNVTGTPASLWWQGLVVSGTTTMIFQFLSAGATAGAFDTHVTNTFDVQFTVQYEAVP